MSVCRCVLVSLCVCAVILRKSGLCILTRGNNGMEIFSSNPKDVRFWKERSEKFSSSGLRSGTYHNAPDAWNKAFFNYINFLTASTSHSTHGQNYGVVTNPHRRIKNDRENTKVTRASSEQNFSNFTQLLELVQAVVPLERELSLNMSLTDLTAISSDTITALSPTRTPTPHFENFLYYKSQHIVPEVDNYIRQTKHLGHFNVDPEITISGFSGGASMALLLTFVFSSFIKGTMMFTGAPYPIGLVGLKSPLLMFNKDLYIKLIDWLASENLIDDPKNLAWHKGVYLYRGLVDLRSPPHFLKMVRDIFEHYGLPPAKIRLDNTKLSPHCIPINAGLWYQDCFVLGPVIKVCNCGFPGVFEGFGYLYPDTYVRPASMKAPNTGRIFRFNTTEFFDDNPYDNGWWDFGYAYIPKACDEGHRCRLHFTFHGCGQNEVFNYPRIIPYSVANTGYVQVADQNNVIVIFPQARLTADTKTGEVSVGCFDFYGSTSPFKIDYATRYGVQVQAFYRMYRRIVYGDW